MEKIKLANGEKLEITTNGIRSNDTTLKIELSTKMTIGEVDALFSDSASTEKIELLSDSDEILKIYNGYNCNSIISKNTDNGIITVEQRKPSDIEIRLEKVEQAQKEQDSAIAELGMTLFEGVE